VSAGSDVDQCQRGGVCRVWRWPVPAWWCLQGLTLTSASVVVFAGSDIDQCQRGGVCGAGLDAGHPGAVWGSSSSHWSERRRSRPLPCCSRLSWRLGLVGTLQEGQWTKSYTVVLTICFIILKTFVGSRKAWKLRCAVVMSFSSHCLIVCFIAMWLCRLIRNEKFSLQFWGYRGGSSTTVQAWQTCPLWEPSPSNLILV